MKPKFGTPIPPDKKKALNSKSQNEIEKLLKLKENNFPLKEDIESRMRKKEKKKIEMNKFSQAKTSSQSNFSPVFKNNFCSIKRMEIPCFHNQNEQSSQDKHQIESFFSRCCQKNYCCEHRNHFFPEKQIETNYFYGNCDGKKIKKFKKH